MCRMGEHQIHLPSEWNNQLRDAAAAKDKGHANHKQECPARYESTSNFVPELKMQLCALCQPICMDTWFFTSLFPSLSSIQTDFLNKRKRFVYYFCVFRKSQGEEQSQEKQPCVQPQVPAQLEINRNGPQWLSSVHTWIFKCHTQTQKELMPPLINYKHHNLLPVQRADQQYFRNSSSSCAVKSVIQHVLLGEPF